MDPAQLLQERLWRAHLPQDSSPLPAELQEAALHDLRPTTDLPDGRAPGPHHGRGPAAPTGMDTRPELAMDWPTLGQHEQTRDDAPIRSLAPPSAHALVRGRLRRVGPEPPLWDSRSTQSLANVVAASRQAPAGGAPPGSKVLCSGPAGAGPASDGPAQAPLPPPSSYGLQRTADEAPSAPPTPAPRPPW